MAKVPDTDSEALTVRIRELTEECRRLREELSKSTKDRIAENPMANDRPMPQRRTTRARPKPSRRSCRK